MKKALNTNIYKNPYESDLTDLSKIGIYDNIDGKVKITQANHCFKVGDVLYYDPILQTFGLALAENTILSEVIGVVYEILNENEFIIINGGEVILDRYSYDTGSSLYLSELEKGKIISIRPEKVIKPVGVKTDNGIMVNIQRGIYDEIAEEISEELESYTKEELDEIIKNIW